MIWLVTTQKTPPIEIPQMHCTHFNVHIQSKNASVVKNMQDKI